jgi:hypothetical protein
MENSPINKTVPSPGDQSPGIKQRDQRTDREKLKKSCSDFEALILAQLRKPMRQNLPHNRFWGQGPGKEVYLTLFIKN